MSCCGDNKTDSYKLTPCPQCRKMAQPVSFNTVRSNLANPEQAADLQYINFYFCETQGCSAVYISETMEHVFTVDDISDKVTVKAMDDDNVPLCYCADVSAKEVSEKLDDDADFDVFGYIDAQRGIKPMNCEVNNPRGECCDKDIEKWLAHKGYKPQSRSKGGCCASGGCCS